MLYCKKHYYSIKQVIKIDKELFITEFNFWKLNFKNTYTMGKIQNFSRTVIGYIKKGYAKFLYKGKTIYASEGDLVYIALGTQYYSVWYGSPDIEWYSVAFLFSSQYYNYEYRFQILKNYKTNLFDKMYENMETESFLTVSYFYRLLCDIYKKLEPEKLSSQYQSVIPAIEYIENNYRKNISIKKLSEICNYSEASIYKLFRLATGVTPITYKHNIMVQHSLDMLKNTDLSIEEISEKTGFSSSNYFRKIFFKITGKTPKELRKK